jgi:hypothetical protein
MICLYSDGNWNKEAGVSKAYRPDMQWGKQLRKMFSYGHLE